MIRKLTLGVLGLSAVAVIASAPAKAVDFPKKNITFLIAYGPGGGFDTITRKLAPYLKKYLGFSGVQ